GTTPDGSGGPRPPAAQPFAAQSSDCEHWAAPALASAHVPQAGRVGSGSPPSVRVATTASTVRPMSQRVMRGSLLDLGDGAKDRATAHTRTPPLGQPGSSWLLQRTPTEITTAGACLWLPCGPCGQRPAEADQHGDVRVGDDEFDWAETVV